MLSDCLKHRKNTESKNPKAVKTKNGRIIFLSNCAVCGSKTSKFIKEQEASAIILNLAKSLSKIPLVGHIFFFFLRYKMYEIINKFLLAGNKFMPEMYLRLPRFTYSACRHFTKNKERTQKFKETGDLKYICKNK